MRVREQVERYDHKWDRSAKNAVKPADKGKYSRKKHYNAACFDVHKENLAKSANCNEKTALISGSLEYTYPILSFFFFEEQFPQLIQLYG